MEGVHSRAGVYTFVWILWGHWFGESASSALSHGKTAFSLDMKLHHDLQKNDIEKLASTSFGTCLVPIHAISISSLFCYFVFIGRIICVWDHLRSCIVLSYELMQITFNRACDANMSTATRMKFWLPFLGDLRWSWKFYPWFLSCEQQSHFVIVK